MRRFAAGILSALFLPASLPAQAPPAIPADPTLVDLTYPFDASTVYWPADRHFERKQTFAGVTPNAYWYASAEFAASEHGGAHLDSPVHFAEGRKSVDQIPLASLIGPAAVIDITGACARNRDFLLPVADLKRWEARHGPIPDGAIVLIRTGWGKYWPDKKTCLGTDRPGDTANLHFPGISEAAAQWLAGARPIAAVGIDTAGVDHGPSRLRPPAPLRRRHLLRLA